MSLLSSGEIKRANRTIGGSMARILQAGSRLQYLDTDGTYKGGTSDAIKVIGDTGGVAAGKLVTTTGYDTTTGYRKVKPADANDATLMRNLYYAPSAISAGAEGYVYKNALMTAQNTNAATVGDPVFLSATAGAWTLTAPTGAGTRQIEIGSVLVKSASIGVIDIDLAGAEAIMEHDHSDASTGGTLSSIAGLTGTTEDTFTLASGESDGTFILSVGTTGTNHSVTLKAPVTTQNVVLTLPDVASDTIVSLGATQTLTAKTLTTPTIADFTNANHDHSDAANGGTLTTPALTGTTNNTFEVDSDCATGTLQLKTTTGGADYAVILTNAITSGLTGDVTVSIPAATTTLVGTNTTQTLTLKTLTAPVINACTLTGAVTITTPTVTGTWTNLGTVTTVNIDGGTADAVVIGGSTPAAGAFTTLSASDDVTIAAGKDISLTAGSGYIIINAASNGALKILPTAATAQTVTLSTIAQTVGAATVSIPDMANTNANFVMTETAQTVNGAKTFGSAIVVPAITGSDASLGIDGTAGAGGGAGGIVAVAAGAGHTNGAGGATTLVGGTGAGTGNGGLISVTGGQSGTGAAADGGAASLVGGAGAGTGASLGGDVAVTGGAAADTGTGGDVTITSGASAGVGGTAGAVAIDSGAPTGGTAGAITIGGTNALAIGIGNASSTTTVTGALAMTAGDSITLTEAAAAGYIQLNGGTSGGIKLLPIATGTALTTISNQNVAAATITLPSATCTLPGLGLANSFSVGQTIAYSGSATNTVYDTLTLTQQTSGTPTAGLGVGVAFQVTDLGGATPEEQASIDAVMATVTDGAEDCDMVFKLNLNGDITQALKLDSVNQTAVIGQNASDADGFSKLTIYPVTASKGSIVLQSVANNAADVQTIIQNGQSGATSTFTTPTAASGTFALCASAAGAIARSDITEEALASYAIPVYTLRAADGAGLGIADTNDAGDHYLSYSAGVWALMGNSPDSDTQTDVSLFQFQLPPEYVAAGDVKLRVNALYTADGDTKTLDLNAYEINKTDGTKGGDICATAAITLTGTAAAHDFTITATDLVAGDLLSFILTTVFQDSDGTTGEAKINSIELLCDIKG